MTRRNPFVVGLTGGIATGKSSVAGIFARHGAGSIDLDDIAKEIVQPGSKLLESIRTEFGDTALTETGTLDRAYLRAVIFNEPQKKQWLESLLHPTIIQTAFARIATLNAPYALLVAPLLIETGLQTQVDRVLLIDANETNQILRASQRDTTSVQAIKSIIQQQAPRSLKLSYAQDVIDNNADLGHLERQIHPLHQLYITLARHKQRT